MKFKFKRKYTGIFFIFLLLILVCVAFYIFGPSFINRDQQFFNQILLISILDSIIITIFILGLYRVNYYLYHDHLEIHRSLHRTIYLNYNQIQEVIEQSNDTIFFMFGKRPSFKVKYQNHNRTKKYRIRVERHDLLKLILENEKKIHITANK